MISRIGIRSLRLPLRQASLGFCRNSSTVKALKHQEVELLNQQRLRRPVLPHLTIYQPQLTWYLSSLHRITGIAMGAAFYALTCTYAATSLFTIPFDSTIIASALSDLPVGVKYLGKAAMAYPFVFHTANGIRHLVWDFGKELTIPGVYRTGYAVLAATVSVGTYFLFW